MNWRLGVPWTVAGITWAMAVQGAAAEGALSVVVSIKPVHSLAASVMEGIGAPKLLVKGGASPHTYSLRPSEARSLESADLIFWIGGGLETFLEKPLRMLARKARVITLHSAPGVRLLPIREGGPWIAHGHEDDHEHAIGKTDMHIWLDPRNAKAMVTAMVDALSAAEPERAASYRANGDRLRTRLDVLDGRLMADLAPVRDKPYIVFYDAYQYFEARYGLIPVGAISLGPHRRPGAGQLRRLYREVRKRRITCVFREPQFGSGLVGAAIHGTPGRADVLDPLGAAFATGPDLYIRLLAGLGRTLKRCLSSMSYMRIPTDNYS